MSAVTQRERRATAGRRMNVLVGKAAEDDETFWGNEVWEEDNESFHASDEDSALLKDEFDSDFDDSEDEEDEDEVEAQVAAARQEDMELMKQERKGKAVVGDKTKKKTKNSKRVIGDGMNAGIVLNLPGAAPPAPIIVKSESKTPQFLTSTLAATRPRRANQVSKYTPRYRSAKNADTSLAEGDSAKQQQRKTVPTQQKKSKKRKYTQEELLLEAANETEPDNLRWLLARKRSQADAEHEKESSNREVRGKVIERIVSRRGYLTTVTFPEMDHVPEVLIRSHHTKIKPPEPVLCVISGKPARYRDPKTGKGYYDAAAFKELRRRLDAGEVDVPPTTKANKARRMSQSPTVTSATDTVQIKDNVEKSIIPAKCESEADSNPCGDEVSKVNDYNNVEAVGEKQSVSKQSKDSKLVDSTEPKADIDKKSELSPESLSQPSGEKSFQADEGTQVHSGNGSTAVMASEVESKISDGAETEATQSAEAPRSASGRVESDAEHIASPMLTDSKSETTSTRPMTAIKAEPPTTPKPLVEEEASPGSRKSPRRWKPTAKVLESIDLAIPGLPAVSSSQQKRQQTDQTDQTSRPTIKYHKS